MPVSCVLVPVVSQLPMIRLADVLTILGRLAGFSTVAGSLGSQQRHLPPVLTHHHLSLKGVVCHLVI